MESLGLQTVASSGPARGSEPQAASPPDVADLIVQTLEHIGVECVFGAPGEALAPLYEALARAEARGGIKHLMARQAGIAAHMADGYTREIGTLGVCLASAGADATQLITGVSSAYENGIPLLALTVQPPAPDASPAAQDPTHPGVNTLAMFRHCTRYNSQIAHPEQTERKLAAAVMAAMQSRGPVHLSLPAELLRGRSPVDSAGYELAPLLEPPSLLDEVAVQRLAQMLYDARRVVLLVGAGCGEAIDLLLQLAELTDSHFVTTVDAKGLVHPGHPLYRGVLGASGHDSATAALDDEVDYVIAFGTCFGAWSAARWCAPLLEDRLIHVDAVVEHLQQSPMARLHVRGRLRTVLERLLALLQAEPGAYVPRDRGAIERHAGERFQQGARCLDTSDPIKPQRLMRVLSEALPPQVRVFADAGDSMAWAVHYLEIRDRRMRHERGRGPERRRKGSGWLHVTMNFDCKGWAIGAGIGAAMANPRFPVVCIADEDAVLMHGQALSAARAQGLNLMLIVLNAGRARHQAAGRSPALDDPPIDFRQQAEAMGLRAERVHDHDDLMALPLSTLLLGEGPCLLDVLIDPRESPPVSRRLRLQQSGRG